MSTQEIIAVIQRLPVKEQKQILEAVQRNLIQQSTRVENDILQKMLAEGLINHIPEGISDDEDDFEPIAVEGKPLSETIIEERR